MPQPRESATIDDPDEHIDEVGEFITTLLSTPATRLTSCRGWTAHELVAHLAAGAAADQRIDDERAMATILLTINKLRLEEREIIALCDWAQLSYAEAATAMGIPIGTVRSRLSRAHEQLRQLTDDAQVGDPDNPNGEHRTELLARTAKERNDEH